MNKTTLEFQAKSFFKNLRREYQYYKPGDLLLLKEDFECMILKGENRDPTFINIGKNNALMFIEQHITCGDSCGPIKTDLKAYRSLLASFKEASLKEAFDHKSKNILPYLLVRNKYLFKEGIVFTPWYWLDIWLKSGITKFVKMN